MYGARVKGCVPLGVWNELPEVVGGGGVCKCAYMTGTCVECPVSAGVQGFKSMCVCVCAHTQAQVIVG